MAKAAAQHKTQQFVEFCVPHEAENLMDEESICLVTYRDDEVVSTVPLLDLPISTRVEAAELIPQLIEKAKAAEGQLEHHAVEAAEAIRKSLVREALDREETYSRSVFKPN